MNSDIQKDLNVRYASDHKQQREQASDKDLCVIFLFLALRTMHMQSVVYILCYVLHAVFWFSVHVPIIL